MARVNLRDRTGLGNTGRTSRVTGDRRRLPSRLRQPSPVMQVFQGPIPPRPALRRNEVSPPKPASTPADPAGSGT